MIRFGGTPARICLSISRLFVVVIVVGGALVSLQILSQPDNHVSAQPSETPTTTPSASHTTGSPATQNTPVPTPTATAAPAQPIAITQLPHSTTAQPVVTPAATASVSGLTPINPTKSTSGDPSTSTGTETTTSYTSANWSGYIAASSNYSAIAGSWTAPQVSGVNHTISADATWIGIGGVTAGDLIQVGTSNTVSRRGQVSTTAFYELLPSTARNIASLAVTPGDHITAALAEISDGQWRVSITDTTTGQSFTTTVAYASTHSSAEWIEEAPSTLGRGQLPLDRFDAVSFLGGTALSGGTNATIAGVHAQPVTMVSAALQPIAIPSALGSDGQSFTVTEP